MSDDARSGVHTVAADDVPFDAYWLHWSTLRTWPVHLAVAWAAYPSRAEIARQGQKPTTFPREKQARAEVVAALISGRLVAYGVPDPGMPWDPAVEIPAERWRGLDLRDSRTLCEPALDRGHRGDVAFRNVEVETSRLFEIWPDMDQRAAPPATDVKPAQMVQMVQSRKASDAELQDFLQSIETPKLTRDEVFELQKAHFGPRALGKRAVFAAYASGSYRYPRLPGERAGK